MSFSHRMIYGVLAAVLLLAALLAPIAARPAQAAPAVTGIAQAATPASPPSLPTPADAREDWNRVKAAGKLVVGTAADYEPFEFYNSNFALDGFDIALIKDLARRMGVEVEFKDFAFDGLLDALRLGQVDTAIAAMSVTPDRQKIVDFSNLYYIGSDAAVARKTFTETITTPTDLADKKIGVERGTTYQSWAQQNLVDAGIIPQASLVSYGDVNTLLRDVRNGTVDIGLLGQLPAQQATTRFNDLRIIGQGYNSQHFGIAARKGSTLIDQLNKALLASQADGTYAKLIELYLQVQPNEVTPSKDQAQVENAPPGNEAVTTTTVVTVTTEKTAGGSLPTEIVTQTVAPPPCIDGMAFVGDLNLDDQNMTAPPVMQPGQDFAKSWRLKNTGTCTWTPDYEVAYVTGNRAESSMGGAPTPVGRTVPPGQMVDVTVSLRAPQVYGTFQGFWKLRDSQGQYFGEVFWVGIQVPDPNPPPPPPPPPAALNPNLRADAAFINYGQCTTIRWDIDNVNAVYFLEGSSSQGVGGHDTRTVCPGSTTTYVLRVVDRNNKSVDFPITITVGGAPNAPYTINFWADTTNLNQGQCTTLRWDVRNVSAVYLNGEGVPGVSAREVCPGSSTTYELRVVLIGGGEERRTVTINVNGAPPPRGGPDIHEFRVSSNNIFLGQCVDVKWRTGDTDGVNIYRSGAAIVQGGPVEGQLSDCPSAPGSYDYRLDAYGNGTKSQSVYVTVSGPQPR